MKIGVIVPRSQLFPLVSLQFCDGMELAKSECGDKTIQFVIEDGGNGGHNETVLSKANKLLLQDRVDTVIAYTGGKTYDDLWSLFDKQKKILIQADMGGFVNYPVITSPYIFHHSLQEWKAAYQSGVYLASMGYKTVLMCLSLMDVGYHLQYAFVKGFESAGGNYVGYITAKIKIDDAFCEKLNEQLEKTKPDIVYCGFAGDDAIAFLSATSAIFDKHDVVLVGPALFTLPEVMAMHKGFKKEIYTASSWYPILDTAYNVKLKKSFESISEHVFDRFSLLGYECAKTLIECAAYNESGRFDTVTTASNIRNYQLQSPRGNCSYAGNQYINGDSYIARVKDNSIESLITTIASDMEQWRIDNMGSHPNEGWLNPYPCT